MIEWKKHTIFKEPLDNAENLVKDRKKKLNSVDLVLSQL